MYLERLPGLQSMIHDYQNLTRNNELVWRLTAPVPTVRRSRQYDYYFSWSRVETDNGPGATLAVFVKNPSRTTDLRDPHAFMLVRAPCGTIEDIVVIFHAHITEWDMGTVVGGIRVVKGVVPEPKPRQSYIERKKDAEKFTFYINKELAKLFILGIQAAQKDALMRSQLELERIESIES